MDRIKLTVIIAVKKDYFVPAETDFPAGIDGEIRKGSSGMDDIQSPAVVMITDRANLLRAFVNRGIKDSWAVYIGDPLDAQSAAEQVTDIWSPFDDGEVLKRRYLLLLDYIKCRCTLAELAGLDFV